MVLTFIGGLVSTRRLTPNVVCLALQLVVEVGVRARSRRRVYQFEFVGSTEPLLDLFWVEAHALRVLESGRPLVSVRLNLLFHLLLEFIADTFAMLNAHLNNL